MIDAGAPTTLTTSRLVLRPPRPDDAALHHALHSDPATYEHVPWALVVDPARNRLTLEALLEHWREHGFGYWVVEQDGCPVGMAGVRVLDDGMLELFYRFTPSRCGQGLATEVARATTTWAAEWVDAPVVAMVRPEDKASVRVAQKAGLSLVGSVHHPADPVSAGPVHVLRSPRVVREQPSAALEAQMLDLWCRVNAAGGAVGFLPDSPREAVAEVLGRELARTSDDVPLMTLRDAADDRLLGFCWWVRDPFVLFAHSVTLKRLMVCPRERGRGLGSILLAGAHAVARTMSDVDLLRLHYRSGLGLGHFYAAHGWQEVGRVPRLIRVAPDDLRDGVEMARRPDGSPLVADGRL